MISSLVVCEFGYRGKYSKSITSQENNVLWVPSLRAFDVIWYEVNWIRAPGVFGLGSIEEIWHAISIKVIKKTNKFIEADIGQGMADILSQDADNESETHKTSNSTSRASISQSLASEGKKEDSKSAEQSDEQKLRNQQTIASMSAEIAEEP